MEGFASNLRGRCTRQGPVFKVLQMTFVLTVNAVKQCGMYLRAASLRLHVFCEA